MHARAIRRGLALPVAVLLAALPSVARGGPSELRACADAEIARLPAAEGADWTELLDGKFAREFLDRAEQHAMAEPVDRMTELALVVETAMRSHDPARARRLVQQIEADSAAQPPRDSVKIVARESILARSNAVAGQADQARAHLDAAIAALAKVEPGRAEYAHYEVLLAAVAMGDDGRADTEMTAMLAARGDADPGGLVETARDIAHAGGARRAMALADLAGRSHDKVMVAIFEGSLEGRDQGPKELALAAEILGWILDPATRLDVLRYGWNFLGRSAKQSRPFIVAVDAALGAAPRVGLDDRARRDLTEIAAALGLPAAGRALASQIKNPWMRAHAEAMVAAELALGDPKAAIPLAREAVRRTGTRAGRGDARADQIEIDVARRMACAALARAGALVEARRTCQPVSVDVVTGLRARPGELVAYWKRASPKDRLVVLAAAIEDRLPFDDDALVGGLCKP